jgi:hypothetical protein
MKYLFIFFTLCFVINVSAQKKSTIFVRVYDLEGNKIAKGNIYQITDTSVILKNNTGVNLPFNNIGYIKTKRSNNHNVLIGTATGGGIGLISVLSSGGSGSGLAAGASKGISVIFAVVVTALGAGVGYLTTLFKKSETYMFNGDFIKWMNFKKSMEESYNFY